MHIKIALPTLMFSTVAMATPTTEFEFHGYIRGGTLMNSDGNRSESVDPLGQYGRWRLGNEEKSKIELLPTIIMKADDGTIARARVNITHETQCSADWNCTDDDGHDTQFREGYVEMAQLPFAPEVVFWAGKRYSSSNTSSHQYDWEYIQYNGTGGGVDKVDLGYAKMDLGLYAFTASSDNHSVPEDYDQNGYPENYSLNLWLKQIGGTGFNLQLVAHNMEKNTDHTNAADDGFGVTALYNFDGFYNFGQGDSRIVFQYGEGLGAGQSLGKNGWGFANSNGTRSWRAVLDGVYDINTNLSVSTFAFYQKDEDYDPWNNTAEGDGWDNESWAVGVRPYHQINRHFAMQYEIGYDHLNEDRPGGANGGMIKATIAPTLTFDSGYWTRPQLRFFITYAKWDEGIESAMDDSYQRGSTDTWNFGVQGEMWF